MCESVDAGTWERELLIELCGDLAFEEALDLW
jgi:hypothetical protein